MDSEAQIYSFQWQYGKMNINISMNVIFKPLAKTFFTLD